MVLMVGCMADTIAVRGEINELGNREDGGAEGKRVVIKRVSAY